MTTKKGNGHDPATAAIVEVLERIEKRLDETNTRLGRVEEEARATNGRLGGLREDVNALTEDVHAGFTTLTREIRALRDETRDEFMQVHPALSGKARGSLAERVTKLEADVARIDPSVFRPTGT